MPEQDAFIQALAVDALEVVQSQLLLQINERNKYLKRCLVDDSIDIDSILENDHFDFLYEADSNPSHHGHLDDEQPRGLEGLIFVLNHGNDLLLRIPVLKLENRFLIERLQTRSLKSQLILLQKQTNRIIHELEDDPLIGNMKHSSLIDVSERLLRTGTQEENRKYLLKWNESLMQVIDEIGEIESNKYRWENFDFIAKRYELQIKLYSYETLSEATRSKMFLSLIEMENRYLTESACRRILFLKVKWLKKHAVQEM
jgi:hypothetical protein